MADVVFVDEAKFRVGLVREEADDLYSSGIDYYLNEKGVIDIDF